MCWWDRCLEPGLARARPGPTRRDPARTRLRACWPMSRRGRGRGPGTGGPTCSHCPVVEPPPRPSPRGAASPALRPAASLDLAVESPGASLVLGYSPFGFFLAVSEGILCEIRPERARRTPNGK
ncbi:hypothetical protein FRAHR75_190073 [Frankia sp. Hr75.2]|nr:hypothetical protein FRAHR75_190073 [Frankia sp. Hr75.2]